MLCALPFIRLVNRPAGFSALAALAGLISFLTAERGAAGQTPAADPAVSRHVEFAPARQHPGGTGALRAFSTFDSAGIASLSCEGAVDWETLLRGRTSNSFREQVLPVLKGTRFLVTLDKDGRTSIAVRHLVTPVSEEAARRAERSIQTFAGVIATVIEGWASYAMTAGLPGATAEYPLDRMGDHYLVAFRKGSADVALTLDRSFSLDEGRGIEGSTTEDGSGSPFPTHGEALAPARFLVTGWAVSFPHGEGSALSVEAHYMQVGGVAVPAEITLHSSLPSFGEITLPLSLSNYQLQR